MFDATGDHFPCDEHPCHNGATCLNTGQSFTCVCKEGFEGQHCQTSSNNCLHQPCANGGTCINGINSFHCACTNGFTGPDCRNKISHCSLNPCVDGSTCVEDSNGFHCLCPPGKSGPRCDYSSDYSSESCLRNGRNYPNDSSWDEDCNRCLCRHGRTVCTRVWCGPRNCLAADAAPCGINQVCLPTTGEACFNPPCAPWGECRPLQAGRQIGLAVSPASATCWPNLARLSPSCARLTLVLDQPKTVRGFSVEGLCSRLRKLAAAQSHLWDSFGVATQHPPLVILCDLKDNLNDVVQVTVVSYDDGSHYPNLYSLFTSCYLLFNIHYSTNLDNKIKT